MFVTVFYRLRAASILLVGINGYGAEVAKNIILAGVKSVTFLDHRAVSPLDACSQFFVPRDQVGKNVSHSIETHTGIFIKSYCKKIV